MKPNKTVVAIYARYSSHAQDGNTSVEVQLDACRKAAGPGPVVEYIDRAKTGRATINRAELLRMLADAEAGKIQRVLLYKYDRLGRSAETHTIVADLEELGIEVESVTEGKDALARGVQLVVAEHYSRALSERTKAGMMKRWEQGCFTGGRVPYGYKVVKGEDNLGRLEVHPEEAEVVRFIYQQYKTLGLRGITKALNERGFIKPREVEYWGFSSVRAILHSFTYRGDIAFCKKNYRMNRRKGKRSGKPNDAADILVRHDESLRIIPEPLFREVRKIIEENGKHWRKDCRQHPLTGLIYCESCGHLAYMRQSTNKKGTYYYYLCGNRMRHGVDGVCNNPAIIREDSILWTITRRIMTMVGDMGTFIEEATIEASKRLEVHAEEAMICRREIATISEQIKRRAELLDHPDCKDTARSAMLELIGDLESKRVVLRARLDSLVDEGMDNTKRISEAVTRAFAAAKEGIQNAADPNVLHHFIESCIGPMTLTRDGKLIRKAPEGESEVGVLKLVAGVGLEPTTTGL